MSVKTANVGHFMIPTAPAAGTAVAQSASANTYGTKTNIGGTSLGALYITGVYVEVIAGTNLPTYVGVQLYVTASTVIDTMNVPLGPTSGVASTQWGTYKPIFPPVPVAATTQILAATASSVASAISYLVTLECILQSNVVDDGITVGTVALVNTLTTYTGDTPQTGDSFLVVKSGGTGDNAAIKTKTDFLPSATAGAAGGVFIAGTNAATTVTTSFTTTFTGSLTGSVGSVTGAVGSVTGAVGSVTGAVGSVTAAVTLANGAHGGAAATLTLGGAGGLTATHTGNTTGSVGSVTGLTASNLDATISSRMATYTQPTGFLAATFPGSVASPTNITAGTITTVTAVTGLTASNLDATVSSRSTYAGGAVASVSGNVGGNVTGSVGSVVGLAASNLDTTVSSRSTFAGGAVASVTGAVGSVTAAVTVTGTPDVNIAKVNGVVVHGDGAGTPWGP